ncbi:PREDICTED: uncharacterized protein LOC105450134 [Wasmannia auropunctata]|uniref:uncharacterized protein LOC105450134 n=1 Tax=Wasmannia auropunctata TaxID=64793 RepID=UPI0005EFD4A0|nr:PREDICTED: uncharacterized protein LOC105450134 [Wasmannia auropunctata]
MGEPLYALVRQFWEQEEIKPMVEQITPEERECEDLFVRSHSRSREGRYTVRLPVASSLPDFATTRYAAARMMSQMERCFAQDARLENLYKTFMRKYEELGHMSRVSESGSEGRICYLPHHGVLPEASTITKLRVVFNGSLVTASGDTLNKNLLTGRNLLPPLIDILLRWRWHRFVFTADIEKMYRQILVHPANGDLQRIIW